MCKVLLLDPMISPSTYNMHIQEIPDICVFLWWNLCDLDSDITPLLECKNSQCGASRLPRNKNPGIGTAGSSNGTSFPNAHITLYRNKINCSLPGIICGAF